MKGRQLTLEEVLNLKDGSKVWVEDTIIKDEQVGIIEEHNIIVDDGYGWFDLNDFCEDGYVIVYEWIEEEPKEIISTYKSVSEIMEAMAIEICNLRGIDLTEDNIDKIVKEFIDKE